MSLTIKLNLDNAGIKKGIFESSKVLTKLRQNVLKIQRGFQVLQKKIQTNFVKIGKSIKTATKKISDFGKKNKLAIAGMGAAFVATALGFKRLINEAGKLERVETQFKVFLKDAKLAKEHVKELVEFTAKTPFSFEGVADTSKLLQGFGFEMKQVMPLLKSIGDVAAAVGQPMKDLGAILGKIRGQGRLTGETLEQLQQRSIPINAALAKVLKAPESAIKSLVSQGKVSSDTLIEAFNSISEEGGLAFNAMIDLSKTYEGKLSTLKDNIIIVAQSLGNMLLPVIKKVMDIMIKFLGLLQESPVILKLIKNLGLVALAFTGVATAVGGVTIVVWGLNTALATTLGTIGIGIVTIGVITALVITFWDKLKKLASIIIKEFPVAADIIEYFAYRFNILKDAFYDLGIAVFNFGKTIINTIEESLKPLLEWVNKIYKLLGKEEIKLVEEAAEELKKAQEKKAREQISLEQKQGEARLKLIDELINQEILKRQSLNQILTQKEVDSLKARYQKLSDTELALMVENQQKKNELKLELEELEKEQDALLREERLLKEIENADADEAEKLKLQSTTFQTLGKERKKSELANQKQELKDRAQHGAVMAKIMKTFRSNEMKGVKTFTSNYAMLTQHSNSKLKAIGKAAAITDITIRASESFFSVYSAMSKLLPFLGPIGWAAAAAPIPIMAAQKIGEVAQAEEGGTIQRAFNTPISGDFQPVLAEPGETILPKGDVKMFRKLFNSLNNNDENDPFFDRETQNIELDINMNEDAASLINVNNRENTELGTGVI